MNTLKDIVLASNLEPEVQAGLITDFQSYEQVASEWDAKARTIVVTSRDQKTEMEMARVAAKKFADMRIAIEKRRKGLKESSLRKGQAIDAIAKFLQSIIAPIENHLDEQANFIKLDDARIEREAEEKRLIEEEKDRLRKEEEMQKEQKRIKEENEKLKKEAEEKDKIIQLERAVAQKALDEEKKKRDAAEQAIRSVQEEKDKQMIEEKLVIDREMKIAADKAYQSWLQLMKYDPATMRIETAGETVRLYKLIGTWEVRK